MPRRRACWVLAAASSEAQTAVRQVLLLQSFPRGNMPDDHFTGNFRVDLDQRIGKTRKHRSNRGWPDRVCWRA